MRKLAKRLGRRNLAFFVVMAGLLTLVAIEISLPSRLFKPLVYFYLFFLVLIVFWGIPPLYSHRRLTGYVWARLKKNRLALFGLGFIVFLALMAILGPFFTQDPTAVNFKEANLPPVGFSTQEEIYDARTGQSVVHTTQGTWAHPLGTDDKGRDLLAMLVSGARVSLQVGLIASGIAVMLGAILGVVSAFWGGWVDNALMRFTDIVMTFPFFLLLVFIVFIFGPDLTLIIAMIGLTGWTGTARLVRSEALSLRSRDFILASKCLGASDARIIFRHLIPNTISSIVVIATLSIPGVILAESALSFIGLGDPTVASWGLVLNAGQQSLDTAWWVAVEPGILLFFTVLAFNFLGDGLRDAFDPRSGV